MDSKQRLFLLTANSEGSVHASLDVGEGGGRRATGPRPLVSFIPAASAFPWASQRNRLRPKPRNVLSNSRASTYPNELGVSSPKWYVLIISDLQDKPLRTFNRRGKALFRCRWRTHRSAAAKSLYDTAEIVDILSSSVQSAWIIYQKCNTSLFNFCFSLKYNLLQILWCQVLNVFQFPAEIGYVRLMKHALQRGGSFTDQSPFIQDEESSSQTGKYGKCHL